MVKAVVCSEHGLPDKLNLVHDWETAELGPNDVRMDVKAAGLNFPDVLITHSCLKTHQTDSMYQVSMVL